LVTDLIEIALIALPSSRRSSRSFLHLRLGAHTRHILSRLRSDGALPQELRPRALAKDRLEHRLLAELAAQAWTRVRAGAR
jgi:hypothetical protein